MKLLILGLLLISLTACSTLGGGAVGAAPTPGPTVLGKLKGTTQESWLPYTDVAGDTSPTLATQKYVADNAFTTTPVLFQPLRVIVQSGTPRVYVEKWATGLDHKDAPTTIPTGQYLSLGGREWGKGSYRLIGFGYLPSDDTGSPLAIGFQETDTSANTAGNFIVASRAKGDADLTVKLTVRADGQVLVPDSYAPSQPHALADKTYVDKHVLATSRPTAPVVGESYFDTKTAKPEYYDGKAWRFSDGSTAP